MQRFGRPRKRPLLALFTPLLFAAGCSMGTQSEPVGHSSFAASVCAGGSTVNGVDVSSYQGTIDWSSVKSAGMDFAIARISDGSSVDGDFASNWSGMKSAGLVRGAYQYWEPGDDPTTEANVVVSAVGMLGDGDLPVTADMETTGGQSAATIVANLQTWAAAVKAGTGKTPMIYTAVGFWDAASGSGAGGSSAFSSNPLWVANWGVSCPDLPAEWTQWVFWQNADNGTVGGISGNVDTDEYNGTLAQLQAFAGGATSSDGGAPPPYYGASYVSQSWPLASTPWMLETCQTVSSSITLENSGTTAWDSNTRLATTQPENRVSEFADQTWVATDRPAQVTGTVAPGDTFEFKFDFHAPPTPGTYTEYFGMVEDGVVWFSAAGQGGPPDDDIEANIQVTAGTNTSCTVDMGAPDGSAPTADAGSKSDAGIPAGDAGKAMGEAGATGPSGSSSGGPVTMPSEGGTAGEGDGGAFDQPATTGGKGCACGVARSSGGTQGLFAAIVGLALGAARRKRQSKRS